MQWSEIEIDDEFASYLPALTDEEREQLTVNMTRADAIGDEFEPVTVWKGHRILLDGHHRYEIAQTLDMVLPIVEVSLPDRAACLSWMRDRQLGRRNLTPDQRRFYLGQKYNEDKGAVGAPKGNKRAKKQKGQDDTSVSEDVAAKLAEEHGVSPATVKRAGKFAAELEKDPAKKKAVMEGKRLPQEKKEEQDVPATAETNQSVPKLRGVGVLRAQEAIDILERIPKNDALRAEGFKMVRSWLSKNQ